jgi:hypothetical protein
MVSFNICKTTNKFTGKTFYYADCSSDLVPYKRISKERYQWLEILHKRHDCIHSTSDSKYVRQYKCVGDFK